MHEIMQYVTHAKPRGPRVEGTEAVEKVNGKKGHRRGVLVAEKVNGVPIIGWSLCHLGLDKFNRATALKMARERIRMVAEEMESDSDERQSDAFKIPPTIQLHLDGFKRRCERYFKVENSEVFGRVPSAEADSEDVPTDEVPTD